LLAKRALQPLLQKAYGPLGDLYGHDLPEEMHRVRRAFKRFRYALEILELAFREVPQDLLSQARKVQDLLGAHHDQVVLQAFLMGERERLEKRSRSALVVGLNLLFTRSEKEREGLFETFRREGPHLSVRAVSGILSRALTDLFP
jgi:CHAD domain-containing protein